MTDDESVDRYCRDLEAYLCRKNDGHLVRIAGPAFERVTSWARQGIPLRVACEGVDRYFERYYRRGPRRRPVRIEFCEADVLDAFDAWRKAVGVADAQAAAPRRRSSLATHVERVMAQLTALRASAQGVQAIDGTLDHIVRRLDALLPRAREARGAARDALRLELAALDGELMHALVGALDPGTRDAVAAAADEALAPFRARMTREAYARAAAAAAEREVRERFGVPALSFE